MKNVLAQRKKKQEKKNTKRGKPTHMWMLIVLVVAVLLACSKTSRQRVARTCVGLRRMGQRMLPHPERGSLRATLRDSAFATNDRVEFRTSTCV